MKEEERWRMRIERHGERRRMGTMRWREDKRVKLRSWDGTNNRSGDGKEEGKEKHEE